MSKKTKKILLENGYVVIPNMLSKEEIKHAKDLFYKWNKDTELERMHNKVDPHGIYKYHQAGHQEHAWYIRTRPKIIDFYKRLWNTNELSVSFDGSCYIPKVCKKIDKLWTHTDQAPNSKGLMCYQGFVALTTNINRTLVVYKGSHLLHEKYFSERSITSSKNWQLIEKEYLDSIKHTKRYLFVPEGSLVIWDSRVFHQNRYGDPMSEERIVQYVCYLPKNGKKNTEAERKKKLKYFNDLRTTSHWPYPVRVNSLQPQNYGDKSLCIDYESLPKPNLEPYQKDILKLI